MIYQTQLQPEEAEPSDLFLSCYMECLSLIERLHRLLLDVIKDEFERLAVIEINPVQALLLYNIAEHEVTAGELRSRGFYQGSNVSYNVKKLVEAGYLHHQRSEVDRRSVRVRLTQKGRAMRDCVGELFFRHADVLYDAGEGWDGRLGATRDNLERLEMFWASQIRYIY